MPIWLVTHMCVWSVGYPYDLEPTCACDPWDAHRKLNLLRCSGHMQTGGVQVFYGVSTVSLRCFGEGVARTCTVTIRCMYGSVRCMYEHRTCLRTPVEFYDHNVCGPYGSRWWLWVHIQVLGPVRLPTCLLRGKNRCAFTTFKHGLLTGIQDLYGLK